MIRGALLRSVSLAQKSRLTASSAWSVAVVGTECLCFLESGRCSVVSNSLSPHGLYNPWNSSGQNTGVGNLSLLQGIFLTQESNQGLLHYRQILYQLSYQGFIINFTGSKVYVVHTLKIIKYAIVFPVNFLWLINSHRMLSLIFAEPL